MLQQDRVHLVLSDIDAQYIHTRLLSGELSHAIMLMHTGFATYAA